MKEHKEELISMYSMDDMCTKRYMDIIIQLREKAEDDLYMPVFYKDTGGV